MKTSTFAFLVLVLVCAAQKAAGEARVWDSVNCEYICPSGPSHALGHGPDGVTACDPAFVTYDHAWSSLKKMAAEARRADASQVLNSVSAEAEKALTKALEEAKTPDRAWAVTAEAWKSGVSPGLQRQALALVRSMAKPPTEVETLNFMLSALENPTAEMERCREWGRGTALERKKAADRLALLLQNPNLTDRLK